MTRTPLAPPSGPAAPGKLDDSIAAIPSLGGATLDPKSLPEAQRNALSASLEELFGTPSAPLVASSGVDGLSLSPDHLAAGARVYNGLKCNQCHGLTGDGRGPTGPWVFPYPRDFRLGLFKASIGPTAKPKLAALAKVIRHGVPGTSMQPYDLISQDDVNAVTAYVIHLSVRGEVEFRVLKSLLEDDGGDVSDECRAKLNRVIGEWRTAQLEPSRPIPAVATGDPTAPEYQDELRRGFRLFVNPDGAGCASCHQDYGRREHYQWDAWGTVVRPSNLTAPEYRWGKTPADTAAHIRFGIPAANMPAHPYLSDEQVKALALFVREMPFPNRLPPDVCSQVYPNGSPAP